MYIYIYIYTRIYIYIHISMYIYVYKQHDPFVFHQVYNEVCVEGKEEQTLGHTWRQNNVSVFKSRFDQHNADDTASNCNTHCNTLAIYCNMATPRIILHQTVKYCSVLNTNIPQLTLQQTV